MPGDDAAKNGADRLDAGGLYIPKTTEGDKLDAAKKFLAFVATPEGCDVAEPARRADRCPYGSRAARCRPTCRRPSRDLLPYFDKPATRAPALEFLSPIKGPALEQITVEVGSGIRPADDGAALYDEDVKKQAQQLGLPGW